MPAQLSVPGRRLLLRLKEPIHSAITVLATNLDPDGPQEAYFDPSGQHHAIGNEPVTEPPVASLTVTEEYLSDWQNEWYTINMEGLDDDDSEPEDMPPTFEPLVVTASNGRFVSIQDYVGAVYPWLMQRREQILRARHVAEEDYEPGADGEEEEALLVALDDPELVRAEDEGEWLATLRGIFEARSQQN
ncbi:hypothetical protein QBC47DRAFT_438846 [Echria macrotheca]|uniref:Uncharacterized protein n=1 Tax=Echria macrotheca TaxID=438768 RepID=A0AAJ0F6T6_9PEZI|nr:hypothetical protein QBC47DRAFT_438846 [Echria macrotheca]